MKKIVLLATILICVCIKIQAQINLVLNSSFEQGACLGDVDNIRSATFWSAIDTNLVSPDCSPEYCNVDCSSPNTHVPVNARFYQYPRSGKALSQVGMFFDESYPSKITRDYLQGRLVNKLSLGKSYCVTFYVCLEEISKYAINHIGAYLDDGSIDTAITTCGLPQTQYTPQIIATSIINDTLNWVKISGRFTSDGLEKFITIGNFFSKVNTSFISLPYSSNPVAYYVIDDVSVIESTETANAGPDVVVAHGDSVHIGTYDEGMPCNWYRLGSSTVLTHNGGLWVKPDSSTSYVVELDLCGVVTRDTVRVMVDRTNVNVQMRKYANVQMWPNPSSGEVTIEHAAGAVVVVSDMTGREMKRVSVVGDKEVIDISSLPKGIYAVQLVDPTTGYKITKKIVKE